MDPKLEQIKSAVCEQEGVPLVFFQKFLDECEKTAHLSRRHGHLELLRKITVDYAAKHEAGGA